MDQSKFPATTLVRHRLKMDKRVCLWQDQGFSNCYAIPRNLLSLETITAVMNVSYSEYNVNLNVFLYIRPHISKGQVLSKFARVSNRSLKAAALICRR